MLTFRSAGPSAVTSRPPMKIEPELGDSRPAIMRRMVVLPQPEGPRIVVNVPAGTSKVTPFTASGARASVP